MEDKQRNCGDVKKMKQDSQKIPLNLRCYVGGSSSSSSSGSNNQKHESHAVLVFDTETTKDEYQNLLFGTCGVWILGKLTDFYIFYADDLPEKDIKILDDFASKKNFKIYSRTKFVYQVFYPYVYKAFAKCIGFNLPFDLSRIAYDTGDAEGYDKFHNGFSLHLAKNWDYPSIRIKSINSKASFIEFANPKNTKKGVESYRGYFLDLKTFTYALTDKSYNLANALKDFGCVRRKTEAGEHGVVRPEYLEYNINDTLATHELYEKALERYEKYGLEKEPNHLYSAASIGKAYLEKIGIKPFFVNNYDEFPQELIGSTMMTYYGGRTEVRIRKQPRRASYIDFTSMYPSVFTLLGMYDFLIAEKIGFESTKDKTQKLLENITINNIQDKEFWGKLTTICKIAPNNDILPARSVYDPENVTTNIGINHVKSLDGTSVWYTLPDLIASKILSGKTPVIENAITFYPEGVQNEIKPIEILKGINLDAGDNLIKKLIEERIKIKSGIKEKRKKNPEDSSIKDDDQNQQILKIIANATSYGIFIQVTPGKTEKQEVTVYGLDKFRTTTEKMEITGEYFNPVMSVFLTASSRLILAAAEALVLQNKGEVMYFDTDSIFVSPSHVQIIQDFFRPLNPYDTKTEMFKVEEYEGKEMHDVWFYGISSKRYVLYDYDEKNEKFTIYKNSSHGLGHLEDMIDQKKWWEDILARHYHPEREKQILERYRYDYAVSQISVSTAEMMRRFDKFNKGKEFRDEIKPFNFVTVGAGFKRDPETDEPIIPMLPFVEREKRREVPYMPFTDYKSRKEYPNAEYPDTRKFWKPLGKVFLDYTKRKESKMKGDVGKLERRYLAINKYSIQYIGKETNELEISEIIGVSDEYTANYSYFNDIILAIKTSDAHKVGLYPSTLQELKKAIKENQSRNLQDKTKKKLIEYARRYL